MKTFTCDKGWKANKDVDGCGITNAERAERVQDFLACYSKGRDGDLDELPLDEQRSMCADMIADLLHLAASYGWGAESVLQLADIHFQSER